MSLGVTAGYAAAYPFNVWLVQKQLKHGLMTERRASAGQGPAGGFVYTVLRMDSIDVVYGTMEGYAALGIPYMPHIAPTKKW